MTNLLDLFTDSESPQPGEPTGRTLWDLFTNSDLPETDPSQAEQRTPSAILFNEKMMFWAMRNLPVSEAVKHLLVCGATGGGKTTIIRLFLQSIAPRFRSGHTPPEQLIIFDAQCDIVPILAAMGLGP